MNADHQPAKDRYPGLCSFEADEHRIFFGRDREIAELLQLIRAEQLVVLFSKSGLGKSSLLSAGVFSRLVPLGFRPVRVRFQQENTRANAGSGSSSPLSVLLGTLHEQWLAARQEAGLPERAVTIPYDAAAPRLWEQIKARPFPNGVVPLLVFDQFEEFFAYPVADQQAFAAQLAELMHEQAPTRVINWLLDLPTAERTPDAIAWSRQPAVKAVFAIRSDRLAEMHSLKPFMTLILRNRYELGPLREEAARDAIQRPGQLPQADGPYVTPSFSYLPAVCEDMLRALSNDNCEIEGSQLQIVCQHVESWLKNQFKEVDYDPARFQAVVDRSVVSSEKEINRILDKFYRTQLRTIGNVADRMAASYVLENELVEGGRRVGLSKVKMLRLLGDFPDEHKEQIVHKLQQARLIRCEMTHLGETYELSHDSLIEPVEKVRNLRDALHKRRAFHEENARKDRELREQAFRLQQETEAKEAAIRQEREKDAQLTKILALQIANKELLHQANRSRKNYQLLTYFFGAMCLLAALAVIYWLRASGKNNELYRGVINAAANLQYERGRHAVAFRLWDDIDSTGLHAFAPYVGRNVQTDARQHYMAAQYNDGTLTVWKRRVNKTDSIVLQSKAVWFSLAGTSLALVQRDENRGGYSVQFINLSRPGQSLINKPIRDENAVTLSADGRYAVLTDPYDQFHLYRLTGPAAAEITGFPEQLATADLSTAFTEFGPRSRHLLVYLPDLSRMWVYDLQSERVVYAPRNIAAYRLADSGTRLAVVGQDRQLRLFDLARQTEQVVGSGLEPFELVQIEGFSPNESAVLISTRRVSEAGASLDSTQLHVFDLRQNRRKLFVRQVVGYRVFPGAGQLGYITRQQPSQTVQYDLNRQQTVQALNTAVRPVATGQSHGLFRLNNGQLTVRDMQRNATLQLDLRYLTSADVSFYAPDGKTDSHLIALYPDSVQVYDLRTRRKSLIRRQPRMPKFGALEVGSRGNTLGNLIRIRMGERWQTGTAEYWCYFLDNTKNRSAYLSQYIYPALTARQRTEFGVPSKLPENSLLSGFFRRKQR